MIPFNGQRSYSRLLSFLHFEANEHVSFFALVIVLYLRLDLRVQKPVCLIQVAHGLRIRVHEPPAESPRRTESPAEDLQPAFQQFRIEVFVP